MSWSRTSTEVFTPATRQREVELPRNGRANLQRLRNRSEAFAFDLQTVHSEGKTLSVECAGIVGAKRLPKLIGFAHQFDRTLQTKPGRVRHAQAQFAGLWLCAKSGSEHRRTMRSLFMQWLRDHAQRRPDDHENHCTGRWECVPISLPAKAKGPSEWTALCCAAPAPRTAIRFDTLDAEPSVLSDRNRSSAPARELPRPA